MILAKYHLLNSDSTQNGLDDVYFGDQNAYSKRITQKHIKIAMQYLNQASGSFRNIYSKEKYIYTKNLHFYKKSFGNFEMNHVRVYTDTF